MLGMRERKAGRQPSISARAGSTVTTRPASAAGGYCESAERTIRRKTRTVKVGDVLIGSEHPVATQTMTTTTTDDVEGTVAQIKKCADAGIDIVRITVQGMREAKACEHIKRRLLEDGYKTPIVADIHFTPKVALVAADFCDKIRVNPGNFTAGRKSFDTITELTEKDKEEVLAKIDEAFSPLVVKLRDQGKALRIGVNHGSLSERILFEYGDSPEGMVASAIEFGEICRKHNFHNFVFSMKASNPVVMVKAYRLLAQEMYRLGWDYPLHVGVTEAGGGADGRIKSATGIGALLLDGLGDTIRVSLTEDPEFEASPCLSLRKVAANAQGKGLEPFADVPGRRDGQFSRRTCDFSLDVPLNENGSVLSTLTVDELRSMSIPQLCESMGLRLRKDGQAQKDLKTTDAIVIDGEIPQDLAAKAKFLLDAPVGVVCRAGKHQPEGCTLLVDVAEAKAPLPQRLGGYALVCSGEESPQALQAALERVSPRMILLKPKTQEGVLFLSRRFFARLTSIQAGKRVPAMFWFRYPAQTGEDDDDLVIRSSADFGSLFVDGLGEGMLWDAEAMSKSELRESSFNLLQASRMRTSKTEFISCPSCGRTLFDIQEVTSTIQARVGHLPGVRIAVMGCIVNGPGEMADADFGYVGSGTGKIDLYVKYDRVKKGIPSEHALEELVNLVKEHGRWKEPPSEEEEDEDVVHQVAEAVLS